jgi:esterase/lipase
MIWTVSCTFQVADGGDKKDSDVVINFENINMPFLNVMAENDGLIDLRSSKALNDALTQSYDKSLIEFNLTCWPDNRKKCS